MLMEIGPLVWGSLLLVFGEATGVCWLVSRSFRDAMLLGAAIGVVSGLFLPCFGPSCFGWMLFGSYSTEVCITACLLSGPVGALGGVISQIVRGALNWPTTPYDPKNDEK